MLSSTKESESMGGIVTPKLSGCFEIVILEENSISTGKSSGYAGKTALAKERI